MTKETLAQSTVRLDIELKDGYASGTGFLYTISIGKNKRFFILTNKHVVEGGMSICMKFATKNGRNSLADIPFSYTFERMKNIIHHPNPKVDLCAIPINAAFSLAKRTFGELKVDSFSSKNLPSKKDIQSLSAVEDLLVCSQTKVDFLLDSVS
jgi:hypothetical protein